MDFGKAFSYPFQDADWAKKIIIPAVVLLIPILGQIIVLGWMLDITRRVIRQDPNPLPDLDFGKNLVDGFKGFVISLVYAIPAIIFSLPPAILPALMDPNNGSDSGAFAAIISIVALCCYGLLTLYSIGLAFIVPAAMGNFIAHEDLGAGFRFGEVFSLIRSAPGAYLLVLVGVLISGFIGSLGIIACGIGVVLTYAYAMTVNGHLYGQAYNEATQNRGFTRA
jgi:hypothetical protein